jgi:hypothetical protein
MQKSKIRFFCIVSLLLIVIFSPSISVGGHHFDNDEGITAGAAKIKITPDYLKTGYLGINDDLHARCLYLSSRNTDVALVALDLLGVGLTDIVEPIRKEAAKRYGISEDYILIGSTHTHASSADVQGVYGGNSKPYIVNEYKPYLIEKVVEVIGMAIKNKKRAIAQVGSIWVDDMTFNRRSYPQPGPTDDELTALKLIDGHNNTIATFINFPCHPVMTMTGNLISADFPGYLSKALEQEFGGVGIFFNGAQGNINPFMYNKYDSPYMMGDPEMYKAAEKFGKDLAKYAIKALKHGHLFKNLPMKTTKRNVNLPLENQGFIYLMLNKLIIRTIIPVDGGYVVPVELSGIKMGPIEMLTVPGELFSEDSLFLKQYMPKFGLLLGLTTEELGYIIPPNQWNPGANEVGESMSMGSKVEPILMEVLLEIISDLE